MKGTKEAIVAFSGDPITNGHIALVEKALEIFDRIILAIGVNPQKKYMFPLQKREEMAKQALQKFSERVKVQSFEGLLVDFAYRHGIKFIVRGARNAPDFDYEKILNDVNQSQKLGITTLIWPADVRYAHISSSTVKELQANHGDIREYVPLCVKHNLEKAVSNQYVIGVTGEIGAGKSYVTRHLVADFRSYDGGYGKKLISNGFDIYVIDMDDIGRSLLTEYTDRAFVELRKEIAFYFLQKYNVDVEVGEGFLDTKKVGNIIFNHEQALQKFNHLMARPIIYDFRQRLIGKKGIILLNSALMAEAHISDLCNNRVILVTADKEIRRERLKLRGYTPEETEKRMSAQMDKDLKKVELETQIASYGFGEVILFENNDNKDSFKGNIRNLSKKILNNWVL